MSDVQDLLRELKEYCEKIKPAKDFTSDFAKFSFERTKTKLIAAIDRFQTLQTPTSLNQFRAFEDACCNAAFVYDEFIDTEALSLKIQPLFSKLAENENYRKFMIKKMRRDKEDTIDSNSHEKAFVAEEIWITSPMLACYIQNQVGTAFNAIEKCFANSDFQDIFDKFGRSSDWMHIRTYEMPGICDDENWVAYNFTAFKSKYEEQCRTYLAELKKVRLIGTNSEEIFYYATSAVRAFFRVFDVLETLLTTGKFEAKTYQQQLNSTDKHPFFKLPISNRESIFKTNANEQIQSLTVTLENVESRLNPKP
ncbi:MAG: hypothetical protein Q8R83_03705 [Legionellaceae bacterium]|nr:hypothetical protein [Legionellaceae bacterium]